MITYYIYNIIIIYFSLSMDIVFFRSTIGYILIVTAYGEFVLKAKFVKEAVTGNEAKNRCLLARGEISDNINQIRLESALPTNTLAWIGIDLAKSTSWRSYAGQEEVALSHIENYTLVTRTHLQSCVDFCPETCIPALRYSYCICLTNREYRRPSTPLQGSLCSVNSTVRCGDALDESAFKDSSRIRAYLYPSAGSPQLAYQPGGDCYAVTRVDTSFHYQNVDCSVKMGFICKVFSNLITYEYIYRSENVSWSDFVKRCQGDVANSEPITEGHFRRGDEIPDGATAWIGLLRLNTFRWMNNISKPIPKTCVAGRVKVDNTIVPTLVECTRKLPSLCQTDPILRTKVTEITTVEFSAGTVEFAAGTVESAAGQEYIVPVAIGAILSILLIASLVAVVRHIRINKSHARQRFNNESSYSHSQTQREVQNVYDDEVLAQHYSEIALDGANEESNPATENNREPTAYNVLDFQPHFDISFEPSKNTYDHISNTNVFVSYDHTNVNSHEGKMNTDNYCHIETKK